MRISTETIRETAENQRRTRNVAAMHTVARSTVRSVPRSPWDDVPTYSVRSVS